ncbi:hypothetical protein [Streptomyces tauricus]
MGSNARDRSEGCLESADSWADLLRDCAGRDAVAAFPSTYGAAFPEADELLAFSDLPPEHWIPTT